VNRVRIFEDRILADRGVSDALEKVATAIVRTANRNSGAPIGIKWERHGDTILIGPRGAAAVAVEFGSRFLPARRPVKRALDTHRVA